MSDLVQLFIDTRVVEAGGRLTGSVRFAHPPGDKLEKVRAVKLVVRAHISGSGSPEQLNVYERELATGPQTGAPLPIDVQLPEDVPVTWEGRHVKVKWDAKVELDIPWAIDPIDIAEFKVVPKNARR